MGEIYHHEFTSNQIFHPRHLRPHTETEVWCFTGPAKTYQKKHLRICRYDWMSRVMMCIDVPKNGMFEVCRKLSSGPPFSNPGSHRERLCAFFQQKWGHFFQNLKKKHTLKLQEKNKESVYEKYQA